MAVWLDHPVRLCLLRHGLSVAWLCREAGVSRSVVDRVLHGLTRVPDVRVLGVLAGLEGVAVSVFRERCVSWFVSPVVPVLSARARSVLLLEPSDLGVVFGCWLGWREEFAGSAFEFSSLVRVSRGVVVDFESGGRVRGGVPDVLHSALVRSLGVSGEYVLGLGGLGLCSVGCVHGGGV